MIAAGKQQADAKSLMESIADAIATMETLLGGPTPCASDGVHLPAIQLDWNLFVSEHILVPLYNPLQ